MFLNTNIYVNLHDFGQTLFHNLFAIVCPVPLSGVCRLPIARTHTLLHPCTPTHTSSALPNKPSIGLRSGLCNGHYKKNIVVLNLTNLTVCFSSLSI